MFDVGFVEMLLIAVLGLLVLGPERLPRVARSLGYWTGRARGVFNHVKSELEREGHNADMQRKFQEQLEEMGLTEDDLKRGQNSILPEEARDETTRVGNNQTAEADPPGSTRTSNTSSSSPDDPA